MNPMIFKPGRHGNDVLVIVVTDTTSAQKGGELIDYLNIVTSNPLLLLEFNFLEADLRPLPGDSSKLYSLVSSSVSLLETDYSEIIMVAVGSCCSAALAVGHELDASAILLISPTSSADWQKQAESEIESRIIPTVILNKMHSSTQIYVFVDSRDSITRTLWDIEPLAQNFSLYSYSWPLNASFDELIEYFKPLISTSILNTNYDSTGVRSRLFDERSMSVVGDKGPHRHKSEILHFGNRDERLTLQGNAQIIGFAAEKYGRQQVKILLNDGASSHIFSVGPVRKDSISFRKWELFQTDYSVSGFSTFGGHGLDIENLALGTFEIRVQVKNRDLTGECSPSNSTNLNRVNFIHRDILSTVWFDSNGMFLSRKIINSLTAFKFPKNAILFTCSESDIVLRSELFGLFGVLNSDIENIDLLFVGDRSFRAKGVSDGSGKQLTVSLDGATPLGDYRLFGVNPNVTESSIIDFNVKFTLTATRTRVILIRSAMGEQLYDFFADSNRAGSLVESSLLNLNNLPSKIDMHGEAPLVVDLLDLALLQLLDDSDYGNEKDDPAIPKIFSEELLAIASEYSSGWEPLLSDLESLVERWPGQVVLHQVVIPTESESSNGVRFFFDPKFVRDLNARLSILESNFLKKFNVVRLTPWAKGIRARMFTQASPSPLQMEEVYFRRFERSLLQELGHAAKDIIIVDDVFGSGISG